MDQLVQTYVEVTQYGLCFFFPFRGYFFQKRFKCFANQELLNLRSVVRRGA